MFSKSLSAFSLFTVIIFLSSCSETSGDGSTNLIKTSKTPQEVAIEFVTKETFFDVDGMKNLLVKEDIDNFIDPMSEIDDLLFGSISNEFFKQARTAMAEQFSFEVKSTEIDGSNAKVIITTTYQTFLVKLVNFSNALMEGGKIKSESHEIYDTKNLQLCRLMKL